MAPDFQHQLHRPRKSLHLVVLFDVLAALVGLTGLLLGGLGGLVTAGILPFENAEVFYGYFTLALVGSGGYFLLRLITALARGLVRRLIHGS